ncbi:MAG TPA: PAS domain S-box protein [Bacteroidales bacterium]|nr:PAS domain S-box protein [Bacteroidales bacterium]
MEKLLFLLLFNLIALPEFPFSKGNLFCSLPLLQLDLLQLFKILSIDATIIYTFSIILLFIAIIILSIYIFRLLKTKKDCETLKEFYHSLVDESPTGMFIYQDMKIVYVNSVMERLTGFSHKELQSSEIWQVIHPESIADTNIKAWILNQKEGINQNQIRLVHKEKEEVWVDIVSRKIEFMGNTAFLAAAYDASNKHAQEIKKLESDYRHSLLMQVCTDGLSEYNLETKELFLTTQWKEMLGYTPDEIENSFKAWKELTHPADQSTYVELEQSIIKGVVPKQKISIRMRSSTGEYRWVQVKLSVVYNEASQPVKVLGSFHDISQQKFFEEEFQKSVMRFRGFFDKNPLAIIVYDTETGNISKCNKAAMDFYGYSEEEITKLNIEEIQVMPVSPMPGKFSIETKHRLKDGQFRTVEIYENQYRENGRPLTSAMIIDVTDARRMAKEMEISKNAAIEAARQKTNFLTGISHEIRTPLNSIIGLSELLALNENMPEEIAENIRSIKYSSRHLLGIINDVLDLSKLEEGQVVLDKDFLNLPNLVRNTTKAIEFKAREKGIPIKISLNPNLPDYVMGDEGRIRQILLNLLSNAVKFTAEGNINIYVKQVSRSLKHCRVRFSVSDTGIGIPPQKRAMIFESFTQADIKTFRKYGGTGLGLPISKRLVELLGGEIGVRSIEGIGSTFFFEIPFEISEKKPDVAQPETVLKEKNLKGLKFLLVEDDPMNRFVILQFLRKWHAEVEEAENGKIALEILSKRTFDVVFMDIHMPEMDGFETVEKIRKGFPYVSNPDVTIIALTADVNEETRNLVQLAGMNDFVVKPTDSELLYRKILNHVAPQPEEIATEVPVTPSIEIEDDPVIVNLMQKSIASLTKIFDDNSGAAASLVKHFMNNIPQAIEKVKNHLKNNVGELAAQALHKIKPGFSHLGFSEISIKIDHLQNQIRSQKRPQEVQKLLNELERDISQIMVVLEKVLQVLEKNNNHH